MTYEEFTNSVKQQKLPTDLSQELTALWYDALGDWDKAHNIVQNMTTITAMEIHAYLHRKEPDEWNANYWYSRAGKKMPALSLDDEYTLLVKSLLMQEN